jgi:hypothetical protein
MESDKLFSDGAVGDSMQLSRRESEGNASDPKRISGYKEERTIQQELMEDLGIWLHPAFSCHVYYESTIMHVYQHITK